MAEMGYRVGGVLAAATYLEASAGHSGNLPQTARTKTLGLVAQRAALPVHSTAHPMSSSEGLRTESVCGVCKMGLFFAFTHF